MAKVTTKWAIDLGTTNTVVARYDRAGSSANIVNMPSIATPVETGSVMSQTGLVPSAVLAQPPHWSHKMPGLKQLASRHRWGARALIGEAAREQVPGTPPPHYASNWKTGLMQSATQSGLRLGQQHINAQGVAELFMYELARHVHKATGEHMHDVTLTVPVGAFEHYRASLHSAARAAGMRNVRFVDEPVAAAIGYGLSQSDRNVLVVDFGGGTLDLAVCQFTGRGMEQGACTVLAKQGLGIGGNTVDEWLIESAYAAVGLEYVRDPHNITDVLEHRFLAWKAQRLKEQLCLGGPDSHDIFYIDTDRHTMRTLEVAGQSNEVPFTQAQFVQMLQDRGLYTELGRMTTELLAQAQNAGVAQNAISDVLLVGGSTLLPGIHSYYEGLFGRAHVRSYDPFRAVATGAAAFAAGSLHCADIIMHDYALVSRQGADGFSQPYVVVPAGTRYPKADIRRLEISPQCSMGTPQDKFALLIEEIGRRSAPHTTFWRDSSGALKVMGPESRLADQGLHSVILNAVKPLEIALDPAHQPNDLKPRLDVIFSINDARWLTVTAVDKKTGTTLVENQPVVELL